MPATSRAQILAILAQISFAHAQHSIHGTDGTNGGVHSLMLNYFHFTPGDTLWFQAWVPTSIGAMVGACIGLFLLAIGERWVTSIRAIAERTWSGRARLIMSNRLNAAAGGKDSNALRATPSFQSLINLRQAPPFILAHDVPRTLLHMVQLSLTYLFMLAVMTFNVGFIFAIVAGEGVGELLFGRYMTAGSVH